MANGFEIVCELEPATRPDLGRVRDQVRTMLGVADAFLVPDNHIGRATVSSIAVAREVAALGGRAIACLNARDRNVLGFRRDLLTAAAYEVTDFLFVYGDRPETGSRSDDLTVRTMLREARDFAERHGVAGQRSAVTSGLAPLASWKRSADALYTQVSSTAAHQIAWRHTVDFEGPVYAAVMVLASAAMGRKLSADIPQLAVPDEVIALVEGDRRAGVDLALAQVDELRASGAFDGVHLVPVSRYAEVAGRLRS